MIYRTPRVSENILVASNSTSTINQSVLEIKYLSATDNRSEAKKALAGSEGNLLKALLQKLKKQVWLQRHSNFTSNIN